MKSAAPIGAKLHIDKFSLAALGSIGVGEGFQPGEIGRALKTVPMRLVAPSADAMKAMRFAGIDLMKLYGIDTEKLKDTSKLSSGLAGMGLNLSKDVQAEVAASMKNADFSQGMGPVQDKLTAQIADGLGMKKGAATDRAKVAKAVGMFFQTAASGLNLEELFKSKDLALSILTPIFGKEQSARPIPEAPR
jgi:hypothetical protein